jgi:hypothetical protein
MLASVIGSCDEILSGAYKPAHDFAVELMSCGNRVNDQDTSETGYVRSRVKHLILVMSNVMKNCLAHSKKKPGVGRAVDSFFK